MKIIILIIKGLEWFVVSIGKIIGGIVLLIVASRKEDEGEE